jgi:hypothetical protein
VVVCGRLIMRIRLGGIAVEPSGCWGMLPCGCDTHTFRCQGLVSCLEGVVGAGGAVQLQLFTLCSCDRRPLLVCCSLGRGL